MVKIDLFSFNGTSTITTKHEAREDLLVLKGAAMSNIEYPEWQKVYIEALLEANPEKLPARIFAAETVIVRRLDALRANSYAGHTEWEAIQDALSSLRVLQRETLDYPGWKKSV